LAEKRITIKATRFDPEKDSAPHLQSYDVPFTDESMVVLDGLNYIKDQLDGTLSYRWSCRMGICGSCGMPVKGEPKLTCATFLSDYAPGPVRVEPLRNFPVIRDLVVEIGDEQGPEVRALFEERLDEVAVVPDLAGRDRVVRGRLPLEPPSAG